MLRLGRVLVALVGIAATLGGALLVWMSFTFFTQEPDYGLGWLFTALSVATLVGTVAIIRGTAWGAVLIALGTGGMLLQWISVDQADFVANPTKSGLAVATVLAIAVAIGMARDKSRRGELTWRG